MHYTVSFSYNQLTGLIPFKEGAGYRCFSPPPPPKKKSWSILATPTPKTISKLPLRGKNPPDSVAKASSQDSYMGEDGH